MKIDMATQVNRNTAAGTRNSGRANIRYSLSKELAQNYDGIISFRFEGLSEDVNFLYKIEVGGLLLLEIFLWHSAISQFSGDR